MDDDEALARQLLPDDIFDESLGELSREFLPDIGQLAPAPLLFILVAYKVYADPHIYSCIELEQNHWQPGFRRWNYLHKLGRAQSRLKVDLPVAVFLRDSDHLGSVQERIAGMRYADLMASNALSCEAAVIAGLAIDGRVNYSSSLIERGDDGRLDYCGEHAIHPCSERIDDDRLEAVGMLDAFWRGYHEGKYS